jgi:hypothetical protein
MALDHMLRAKGKESTVYHQDPTPENYRFQRETTDRPRAPPPETLTPPLSLTAANCSVSDQAARIGTVRNLVNIDHQSPTGVL